MSEYGSTTIGKETQNLEIADAFEPYSGVRLSVGLDNDGNELVYFSGDETGRVLDVENPFGSQQMANNILASIQGFVYQPMYADGALLDPAAQIGDAVSVNDIYSRICVRATTFGTLMLSDVSSPASEEIVHEYNIPTPEERKFQRLNYDMKSEFSITNQAISAEVSARQSADSALSGRIDVNASAITAKVSKNSPSGQTSFGWALSDSEWRVFNQSGNILRATSAGLEVKGKIQADEGYIGGESGFVIKSSAIYNTISSFGGSGNTGVYVGTDGIQLGQNFKVDSSGAVRASNLEIVGGSIVIGDGFAPPDPISRDGFTFYNWGCAVDTDLPPSFMMPDDKAFTGLKLNGVNVSSSNYTASSSLVTLKTDYIQHLGTSSRTFTISYKTQVPGGTPDDIVIDGITYKNWYNDLSQTVPMPEILIPYDSTVMNGVTFDGATSVSATYTEQVETTSGGTFLHVHLTSRPTTVGEYTCQIVYVNGEDLKIVDCPTFYTIRSTTGTETAPTLTIRAAEGRHKFFSVDSSGAVTATNLTILGGSIRIGENFVVDSNGNVYAETGYFRGGVSAGQVEYGSDAGYFDGYGLTGGTVTNDAVDSYINTDLGYANFANSVFNGWDSAPVVACDGIVYNGHFTGIVSFTIAGVTYNCIGWESSPSI